MDPGRNLDLLVAEKVFNFEKRPKRLFEILSFRDMRKKKIFKDKPIRVSGSWKPVPRYSTDIRAAWEVVEHLKKDADNHMVEVYWDVDTWYCSIHHHSKGTITEWRETAPHAICLAALKLYDVK